MDNHTAKTIDELFFQKTVHLDKAQQAREEYRYHVARAMQAEKEISYRRGERTRDLDQDDGTTDFVTLCY